MIDGVFVSKLTWGQKYLFASVSIPGEWLNPDAVTAPRDLGVLLASWHSAFLELERQRQLQSRAASEHGARAP